MIVVTALRAGIIISANHAAPALFMLYMIICGHLFLQPDDIFYFHRFLNRETFGQTILLLSSAILMTDVSLLLTNERSRVSTDVTCVALAMFRQFAILHQLLAVSVYARYIVSAITCRAGGDHVTGKHFTLKGILLAYGTRGDNSFRCKQNTCTV